MERVTKWGYMIYQGDQLWHQRLIHGRVALSASSYVVPSPDFDVQVEDYGNYNEDITSVRYVVFGEPPPGVPRGAVYRFAEEPVGQELADLRREAMLLAEQECRGTAIRTSQMQVLNNLVFLAPLGCAGGGSQGRHPSRSCCSGGAG